MERTLTALFKVVEPMIFRGPGEFEPLVRGSYVGAVTMPIPLPSTIAGALASHLISTFKAPPPAGDDWVEQFKSVLGADVQIRGPFIKFGPYLTVGDMLLNGCLSLESLMDKCRYEFEKLLRGREEDCEECRPVVPLSIVKDVRTGVRLETRSSKPVKRAMEGYLFTVEYVDYVATCYREFKEASAEIIVEIEGSVVEKLREIPPLPIKLGGESRVVKLSFMEGPLALNLIKEAVWRNVDASNYSGELALYVASPALFKGGRSVKDYIQEWVGNNGWRFIGVVGGSTALSAGFSIRDLRRKPVYSAVKPGSIVFVKADGLNFEEIYRKRPLGEVFQLGYGTLIPVPIAKARE